VSASEPVRRRVTVLNAQGLHARPAVVLAERARQFSSDVALVSVEGTGEAGTSVDAKNAVDVLLLGAPPGAILEVQARGPDADSAVDAIVRLFAQHFGTEEPKRASER
jgi:phosphotransferase system HPr (HPr) family protein